MTKQNPIYTIAEALNEIIETNEAQYKKIIKTQKRNQWKNSRYKRRR